MSWCEVCDPSFNDPTARPRAYWHEHPINCTPFADCDWLCSKVERASIEGIHPFCCPKDLCMLSTQHPYGIRQGIQSRRDPPILATVSRDFMRFLLETFVPFLLQWTPIYRNNRINPCYSGCIDGVGETAILERSKMDWLRTCVRSTSISVTETVVVFGGVIPKEFVGCNREVKHRICLALVHLSVPVVRFDPVFGVE